MSRQRTQCQHAFNMLLYTWTLVTALSSKPVNKTTPWCDKGEIKIKSKIRRPATDDYFSLAQVIPHTDLVLFHNWLNELKPAAVYKHNPNKETTAKLVITNRTGLHSGMYFLNKSVQYLWMEAFPSGIWQIIITSTNDIICSFFFSRLHKTCLTDFNHIFINGVSWYNPELITIC